MNKKIIGFFVLLILFFYPQNTFAVTTTILSTPSEINSEPFTIIASVSGNISGTHFLRIDLFKEGTTNYFGETYNGSSWYGGSEGTQYFPFTVIDGVWSGSLQGKVGDPSSTEYQGPGNYKMRVRRYTSSGNAGDSDEQTVDVNITIDLPTETPEPTDIPTPSPTPTPTNTPTKTPTAKPTPKITPTPTKSGQDIKVTVQEGEVLGTTTTPAPSIIMGNSNNLVSGAKIALILGLLFCGMAVLIFTQRFQDAQTKKESS